MVSISFVKSLAILTAFMVLASCETTAETQNSEHSDADITWTQYSYDHYPLHYFVDDVDRYNTATPPANTVNRNGE